MNMGYSEEGSSIVLILFAQGSVLGSFKAGRVTGDKEHEYNILGEVEVILKTKVGLNFCE